MSQAELRLTPPGISVAKICHRGCTILQQAKSIQPEEQALPARASGQDGRQTEFRIAPSPEAGLSEEGGRGTTGVLVEFPPCPALLRLRESRLALTGRRKQREGDQIRSADCALQLHEHAVVGVRAGNGRAAAGALG